MDHTCGICHQYRMIMTSWRGYTAGHCAAAPEFKTVRSMDPGCQGWTSRGSDSRDPRIETVHSVVVRLDLDFERKQRRKRPSLSQI